MNENPLFCLRGKPHFTIQEMYKMRFSLKVGVCGIYIGEKGYNYKGFSLPLRANPTNRDNTNIKIKM